MIKTRFVTFPLFVGALLFSAGSLSATTFTVAVNTSSISGDHGSIDFQFNPGVGTFQSATAVVGSFTGGMAGGSQTVYGTGVTGGPAPAAITLTNVAGQDNEVLDTYTFGNVLDFTVSINGPAITSPAGNNSAGSLFSFFVYSDAAGNNSALTSDPNGVAFSLSLSPQGVLTSSVPSSSVQLAASPEPASIALISAPLAFAAFLRLRRRKRA